MSRSREAQTRAKARYNKRHYEQIMLRAPIGARDTIQDLAAVSGMSVAEYIRHCIIADAAEMGYDVWAAFGGGGVCTALKADADAFAYYFRR